MAFSAGMGSDFFIDPLQMLRRPFPPPPARVAEKELLSKIRLSFHYTKQMMKGTRLFFGEHIYYESAVSKKT